MGASAGVMAAFQAAGAAVSIFQEFQNRGIMELGRKVEADQLQTNLQILRTQSAQASQAGMEQLKQNIGSQIAIQAARGTAGGVGSAASLQAESIGKFGADERTRRLNLLAKTASLRAQDVMSAFSTLSGETRLGQSVSNKIFDTVSTTGATGFLFGSNAPEGAK